MDIQMPELDGEQAARQIRALGSLIRQPYIIALTALTLPHGHTQALDAGMNDYLHKPIQLEALRAALNRTPLPPNAVDPMIDEQQAPLLDWQALDAVACSLADDRQAVQTTVHALFVGELAGQIDALNMADIGDRARIAALAHRIRGGSHQLGALRLVAWCTALEHQAVTAEPELIDRLRAQIRLTFQQTLDLAQERYGAPIRK
jgi:CheY-like chemotaxis protein